MHYPLDFFQVIALQGSYNTKIVLLGSLLLGISAGLIGAYLQLFKRSLLGDTISHAAFPGIVLAFLVSHFFFGSEKIYSLLILGALLSSGLGLFCIHLFKRYTRISDESALGIILSVFFGVGVLLLSLVQELPQAAAAGLQHYIYGQASGMRIADVQAMFIVSLLTLVFIIFLRKELTICAFDRQFASVLGLPATRIDIGFLFLLLILSIIGFQNVGILLMVALLVLPAATARLWTNSINPYLKLSAMFGGLSCYLGTGLSSTMENFPTGAIIVLVGSLFFAVSLFLSPKFGIISKVFKQNFIFNQD